MWSSKTKPTPANIRKRIDAAVEALRGAELLMENHGGFDAVQKDVRCAIAWAYHARSNTMRQRRS